MRTRMRILTLVFLVMTLLVVTTFMMGMAGPADTDTEASMNANSKATAVATLAGGCFWCVESALEKLDGVTDVVSGYTGGDVENPTYDQVSSGSTGHLEAVQVHYDPAKVSYEEILDGFWKQINPTDDGGQFADRGEQYSTAIFYHDETQKEIAEASKAALEESNILDKPVVTPILPAQTFYEAEEYHQDYYKKHPIRYKTYRFMSGRDGYVGDTWDGVGEITPRRPAGTGAKKPNPGAENVKDKQFTKPSDAVLRDRLTKMQYKVTQKDGTEPPFENEYHDNKEPGIYVDIVSGEPLFSSQDKFDSGTGWPSFTKPLEQENITEHTDTKLWMTRTEVRSKHADSHLGHVFEDGPEPTGLRYCLNSAALRFIPADKLEEEGYGEYAPLFE